MAVVGGLWPVVGWLMVGLGGGLASRLAGLLVGWLVKWLVC